MLNTTDLSKFLKGITDALRAKKGTTDVIEHKLIDEEILNLSVVDEEDDNINIIKAILKSRNSGRNRGYEDFFAGSDINDTQLATFAREFPNMLGKPYGSSMLSVTELFCGCKNLTVIPKNAFYTDSRGIRGTYLFGSCVNIVAIWVPLRFYCEDSGNNSYYLADQILPLAGMSNSTLKEIRVAENGIKQSIDFSHYYGFSKESYMSIADGLIDLTGTGNAYKLTINGSYRVMGNDYDKFTLKVHNKGWTLAFK